MPRGEGTGWRCSCSFVGAFTVDGAGAGLAARVRAAGHEVYTPTLTGLDERAYHAAPGVAAWSESIVRVREVGRRRVVR